MRWTFARRPLDLPDSLSALAISLETADSLDSGFLDMLPASDIRRWRTKPELEQMDDVTAAQLKAHRDSIDNFDRAILHILAERFKVTGRVGVLKRDAQLPPADLEREQSQIVHLRSLAESLKMNPDFIERIYWLIIEEVTQNHIRLRENPPA